MIKKLLLSVTVVAVAGYYAGQYSSRLADGSRPVPASDADLPATAITYTCPMHAHIHSDVAGSCPICGMQLVANRIKTGQNDDDETQFPAVTISATVRNNLAIRTARVERAELKRSIETIGKITRLDPTARRVITPPIAGELVYVAEKNEGDAVQQGELLFSVISDELIEKQKAYQAAFESGNLAIATAMIPELRAAGLNPQQIARLQAGEAAELPAEIYSSEQGFVFSRRGRTGDKVTSGFTVFNLGGDYQVVEVTAEIFEREWGRVEEGQEATMVVRGLPGVLFTGKVVRVEPPVGYTTRSLEVRLKFNTNHPDIAQSMFAHISIAGKTRQGLLLVPRDAVIHSGEGTRVVRLREDGSFQPVAVVAGEESLGKVEIISGLDEYDPVVVSGQFLIDSESNLLAGLRRMSAPAPQVHELQSEQHQHHHHEEDKNKNGEPMAHDTERPAASLIGDNPDRQ